MKNLNSILCLSTVALVSMSANMGAREPAVVPAKAVVIAPPKSAWNGFYVGGLLGGKFIAGKGSVTTIVDGKSETASKDEMAFPLPSHTLNLGYGSEIGESSTIAFGCDFDYGVLPTLKLAYGYLVTPKDRLSFEVGLNTLLLAAALSSGNELEVKSLYGFTPAISYERSLGNGAFFQVKANYNYLSVKGNSFGKDFKFPTPVKRFVRDYWDRDVHSVSGLDAEAHGVTLSMGFGCTL